MPYYCTQSFKELTIKMYFRKGIFEEAYDVAAAAVAHEFSHVVLESTRHPFRKCEKVVDLTAMLLGFSRVHGAACYKEQRLGNTIGIKKTGYLSREEVQIVNQTLAQDHRRSRIKVIRSWLSELKSRWREVTQSLLALIAGLKGRWQKVLIAGRKGRWCASSVASREPFAWGLAIASIALVALVAFALTLFVPTVNNLAQKIRNAPNVRTDISLPPTAPGSTNTASEISVGHVDVSLAEDAKKVQGRLADLGFYSGRKDGVWGPASRKALGEFKLSNGLVPDDRWDADTEQSLYADRPHRLRPSASRSQRPRLSPVRE